MARLRDILRRAAGAIAPARLVGALRRHGEGIRGALASLAFLAGLGLIAFGVGMISVPAGLIVAGVEISAAAALYARGEGAR
jgi:hypothetical protein